MNRYEFYLFVHVAAAIVWIGAAFLLQVLALQADRARSDAALKKVVEDTVALAKVLFIPSSLTLFVFGLLMVVDGPWSFEQLWITIGLAGWAATFVTGIAVIRPRAERIGALMEEEGGLGPRAAAEARKLLIISRIDLVVLFLVVADMVIKPTGDDVGTLVVMAVLLVAGVAWSLQRARSIEARPSAGAPA
jgi:uncharacterized membrane protein